MFKDIVDVVNTLLWEAIMQGRKDDRFRTYIKAVVKDYLWLIPALTS